MRGFGILNGPRSRVSVADDSARCPSFPWLLTNAGYGGALKRRFADRGVAEGRARRLARTLRADGASVILEIADAVRT
ncbi:hypothetical protein [Azospirillum sp. BE72]|uniref:hypothetical protein n=1 Tax=Azospirillum sp. BE72 TaxID=2817776 RepID=UPI00285ABB10|nr:hypothetical protein [Azospirillum sp. BE72]MDR6775517.1 hypothetical protein [Azospirillum sp. BE72]